MDKEEAVFEQLTLSDFKKWIPTALGFGLRGEGGPSKCERMRTGG